MPRALLLVMSDEKRRTGLVRTLGALGFELVQAADPLLASKQISLQPLVAVVAELGAKRLALGKLLQTAKAQEPRPRSFVLAPTEGAEPADDAWEAVTLSADLSNEALAAQVQRTLTHALPEAWRYQPLRTLGQYETWTAHWALAPGSQQPTVLARVSVRHAEDVELREQFFARAQQAKALGHPSVAAVDSVGGSEADALPFVSYRAPSGLTLSELLRAQGPAALEPALVLHVGIAVAQALGAVHASGLGFHGGVERRAVWLTEGGSVQLLYAGIAPLAATGRRVERAKGAFTRRMDELAPEQIRGAKVDARTDLYGLGMLLYVLLTKEAPFARRKPEDGVASALNTKPPPPSRKIQGLPQVLDTVLLKLLEKDRADRPARIEEVVDKLRQTQAELPSPSLSLMKRLFGRPPGSPAEQLGAKIREGAITLQKVDPDSVEAKLRPPSD